MNFKVVSQLDAAGYYVGVTFADESPLEPGVFLLPGGAIDAPVPSVPEGKRAKWAGDWGFEDLPQPKPELVPPQPKPELVPPQPKQLTSLEFLDLFTEAEQVTVVSTTMTSPIVKLWYDKMLAAMNITLSDPRTEAGLDALVDAGLLSVERKAEIVEAMK